MVRKRKQPTQSYEDRAAAGRVALNVWLDVEISDGLNRIANETGRSKRDVVQDALKRAIARRK